MPKFFNLKTITIFISLWIVSYFALHSVYAAYTMSSTSRPQRGGNVIGPGGVSIKPENVTVSGTNTGRVSYVVSYTNIYSQNEDNNIVGIELTVPKEAKNIQFSLVGTVKPGVDEKDLIQYDDYMYTPVDVNVPLNLVNSGAELLEKMPTEPELANYTNGINGVYYMGESITSLWYDAYYLIGNKYPTAVRVSFDIAGNPGVNYVPLRAFIKYACYKSPSNNPFVANANCSAIDTVLRDAAMTEFFEITNENGVVKKVATEDSLPMYGAVSAEDIIPEGLHTHSSMCSLTKKLSAWYKFGPDITPMYYGLAQKLNLFLAGTPFYGASVSDDYCDQVVNTLTIN